MEILNEVPALVVLERLPVPVLAVDADGTILFANSAFAAMVGRAVDAITGLSFADVLDGEQSTGESAVSVVRAHGDTMVDLLHEDGSPVRARMSTSALVRDDDPLALATFQDLTEQLWIDEI